MAAALYDPDYGYYTRRIKTVGRGGDFSTSATLSPLLGRAVVGFMQSLGTPFSALMEVGPGNGALASSMLKTLGWWQRWKLNFWLVEKSPVLRQRQRELLGAFKCVRWAESVSEAAQQQPTLRDQEVFVFSNELVDAFPVVLAEWREGVWQEVWVEISADGRLVETLRPLRDGIADMALGQAGRMPPSVGQRVEIPWSYREWLVGLCSQLGNFTLLTIDYGGTFDEISSRRSARTLRSYLHHERRSGLAVYENMGHQDITADVCFDHLVGWGNELGLESIALTTQAEFLQSHGRVHGATKADEYLLRSDGAGGAFRVLVQRRALPQIKAREAGGP